MNYHKSFALIFSFCVIMIFPIKDGYCQEKKKEVDKNTKPSLSDRIYWGGNFGLNFGDNTAIDLSPIVGYRLTENFSAGIGITYQYFRFNKTSFSIYGGRFFGRYLINSNLFAHAEYEMLNVPYFDRNDQLLHRRNIAAPLVGGGYSQSLGGRAFVSIMALWNLDHSTLTPYPNPVIRIGLSAGR